MAAILMTSLLGPDAELRWANWLKLLQIPQSLIIYSSPKIVTKFTRDHFFGPFDIDYLAQFIKTISHYKKLAIAIMYCNRLHAMWLTQSRLATVLSSLIACWGVGFQTMWRFRLKVLSIDEIVGAECFGSLSGPPGFTCWISFAPVFSFIYC